VCSPSFVSFLVGAYKGPKQDYRIRLDCSARAELGLISIGFGLCVVLISPTGLRAVG
jgi:hypothetical protein